MKKPCSRSTTQLSRYDAKITFNSLRHTHTHTHTQIHTQSQTVDGVAYTGWPKK